MDKHIRVEVRDAEESAQEFVKAWRRAKAGEPVEEPVERLYFQDLGGLLQVLTPRRLELLRRLHEDGPESVRALAKKLSRDYKNVHTDAAELLELGLLERDADGRLSAPFDEIVIHANIRNAA